MLRPYSVAISADKNSYQFQTSSGNLYLAYFTEFVLTKVDGSELIVLSFGFCCISQHVKAGHDPRIRLTISFLIHRFFEEHGKDAILYLCLNNDGRAKYRHRTFNLWYENMGGGYVKHQIVIDDFYSSILFLDDHPNEKEIIDAFNHTITTYWHT